MALGLGQGMPLGLVGVVETIALEAVRLTPGLWRLRQLAFHPHDVEIAGGMLIAFEKIPGISTSH